MSPACTPGLVGVASVVLEIWLPFKNGQISNILEPAQKFYAGKS